MNAQSLNRFEYQGVMSPKNTVRIAGVQPSETAITLAVASGGFAVVVSAHSVGAMP